jgi:hypothetical protein
MLFAQPEVAVMDTSGHKYTSGHKRDTSFSLVSTPFDALQCNKWPLWTQGHKFFDMERGIKNKKVQVVGLRVFFLNLYTPPISCVLVSTDQLYRTRMPQIAWTQAGHKFSLVSKTGSCVHKGWSCVHAD